MVTIRNTNDAYGDPVEITGETLGDAVAEMQASLRACGPEFSEIVVDESDYEIVIEPDDSGLSDEDRRKLGSMSTRDDAGRHFTEVYDSEWLDRMESAGLIVIHRPIHRPTGIPYGSEEWSVTVAPVVGEWFDIFGNLIAE